MHKNILASSMATAGVAFGIGAAAFAIGTGAASAAPSDNTATGTSSSESPSGTKGSGSGTTTASSASKYDHSATEPRVTAEKKKPTKAAKSTKPTKAIKVTESAKSIEIGAPDAPSTQAAVVRPRDHAATVAAQAVGAETIPSVTPVSVALPGATARKPAEPWTPQPTGPQLPQVPPADLFGFVNWVGANIQRTFFNRTPTTSPIQFVQTDSGEIVGQLGASDADGDDVVYALVTGPSRGSVVLHDDGSYTYTPNPTLVGEGGADTFTVKVSDVGWHLHLFNGTGSTTSTVVVDVASDTDVTAPQTSTRGFNIYNLSAENMVFKGYTKGGNRVDSGPAVGTVIAPGSNVHVEVVFRAFGDDEVTAQFSTATQGDVTAWMLVTAVDGEALAACRGSYCTPNTEDYQETTTVTFLDAPGTRIEIPAGEGQRQAEVLNQLCSDTSSSATCKFDAGRQEKGYTPGVQVSPMLRNPTDYEQTLAHQVSTTEGYSDSLGGSVKFGAKLTEAINLEIQATYNHTWTTSNTWGDTITIKVPPWTEASIWSSDPYNRVWGDLTVTMGNTTWVLRDVYFDSPDSTAQPVFEPHYEAIPHDPGAPAITDSAVNV